MTRRTFIAKVDLSGVKWLIRDFRNGLKREQIII